MESNSSCAVALGNFDGLHLGHRRLIQQAVAIAETEELVPTVWSFASHPALFLGKEHPGLLMQAERKSRVLESLGIQREIAADFSRVRHLSPEHFAEEVLIGQLDAAHVICGFNYSFGKNAQGDVALLQKLLLRRGVKVTVVPPVTYKGETVSSSRIRRLLQEGSLEDASAMLGAPLRLDGQVERGKQLGRQWGIPTANLALPKDFVKLRHGVYATRIHVGLRSYPAVTNVGLRPTVEGSTFPNCESHLLHFSDDLYGTAVSCDFLHFIRPEQRFDSADALKERIQLDIREVERYFESQE